MKLVVTTTTTTTTKECVWIEIPVSDNLNLLIGNHSYTFLLIVVSIIDSYLKFFKQNLNVRQYQVIMSGDFNVPNYDWIDGAALLNFYYYGKIKGNSIHTAACSLGLVQRSNCIINSTLFDVVFSSISDISASVSSSPMVTLVKYHPPILDFNLTVDCHQISQTPQRSYAQGDCMLLFNVLRHSDWSCALSENCVDSAVNNPTGIVRQAINVVSPYIK
jgi:hypothetical protein